MKMNMDENKRKRELEKMKTINNMAAHRMMDSTLFKQKVRKVAKELYEKSNNQSGRDMDNWLKAEIQVKNKPVKD